MSVRVILCNGAQRNGTKLYREQSKGNAASNTSTKLSTGLFSIQRLLS